jgi:hypothetical protein
MAVWPSDVIPSSMRRRRISPGRSIESPLTATSQDTGSASHLWELEYTFPPITPEQARACDVVLARSEQEDTIAPVYQPGFSSGTPGTVTVATGATGFSLPVAGIATGYGFLAGQFISVTTSGRIYTYMIAADSPAGSATRTLTLTSAILEPHANGDPVAVIQPMIQGRGYGETMEANDGVNYNVTLRVRQRR